ncbi:MAG: RNA polymerase sigma factor [Fimbriimonadaceae bacterium]
MDDRTRRAARGDREAMGDIAVEHYSAIYRFCARRLGPELAADAAQETFLTAQKAIKRFDGTSALSTWLFGIALNTCRNLARKRRIEMNIEHAWNVAAASPGESTLVDREALRGALKKLTSEHLEVVILHEVEGMTYEEAAGVLGVPVGTVKSRLHHAFVSLRRFMGVEVQA